MDDLPAQPGPPDADVEKQLDAFARRHRAAGGLGMQVLGLLGGQAENLLERLPDNVKNQLESVTETALLHASTAAGASRGMLPDQAGWLNTAVASAMGAAGGFGGLPTALAELPVTITVLLRAIQGIAAEHGVDPDSEEGRMACIQVLASAGPLQTDDDIDMAFLAARVTLTGGTVHGLIARVAPRLATALGQKLAAQTVPVIGAVTGAATNYAYTSYYQEMARIRFGIRKLARETGQSEQALGLGLRDRLKKKPRR